MDKRTAMRRLPAVHRLLARPEVGELFPDVPLSLVTRVLGDALGELRSLWTSGPCDGDLWERETTPAAILQRARMLLDQLLGLHLRPVVNATGTVIHTNLGRAPLSQRAQAAVLAAARSYSNLEYDIQTGQRGSRQDHVEARLCRLTGAEAGMVVNNNAAASLLVLKAMASGGEAIVSRGQLVEIGGSFRVPEIMAESGVRLVEVGTTNKTRLDDYDRAVSDATRLVMRVHTSNYRIIGFTEQPDLEALVQWAHGRGLPIYEDLGSGALFDFRAFGVGDEPTVHRSIQAGVDVVSFSGDKLLGGAQAGIIVGKREWIERFKGNPLARAVRVDKLTLAALEASLVAYEDADLAKQEIPVVAMITTAYEDVAVRAERLRERLQADEVLAPCFMFKTMDEVSRIGGGALPEESLPTRVVAITTTAATAQRLCDDLRRQPPVPVVARIVKDQVVLDPRTLLPGDEHLIVDGLRAVAASYGAPGR